MLREDGMTLLLVLFGFSAGIATGAAWASRGQGNKLAAEYHKGITVGYRAGVNEAFGPGAATLLAEIETTEAIV